MCTATAPGKDLLPYDLSKCSHRPDLPCQKRFGCKTEEAAAALWNTCAPQAWSWLMERVRRIIGRHVEFWKCWETQDRGVLHLHAILWAEGVSEDRMRAVWAEALADTSGYKMPGVGTFVWGTQQKVDRIGSRANVEQIMRMGVSEDVAEEFIAEDTANEQRKFVRYGAKYCTKGGVRATTVSRRTGEIRHNGAGYRTWSASAKWGLRMRSIRAEQVAWATANAAGVPPSRGTRVGAPGDAVALDPDTDFYAQRTAVEPSELCGPSAM